ncbi:MAG: DUF4157 domain-containing protein, partial [Roseicyclus sp.]
PAEARQAPLAGLSAVPGAAPVVRRACEGCAGDARQNDDLPGDRAPAEARLRDLPGTPVQPRLEVGPADDGFEREADRIAGHVMAMLEAPAATPGAADVQRACASCAEEADRPRLRRLSEVPPAPVQRTGEMEAEEETVEARRDGAALRPMAEGAVQPRRDAGAVRRMDAEMDDEEMPEARHEGASLRLMEEEEGEDILQLRRDGDGVRRMDRMEDEGTIEARREGAALRSRTEAMGPRGDGSGPRRMEEAETIGARRAGSGAQRAFGPGSAEGGETLAASAAQLTSGGQLLPRDTRAFFEARMGHDLSSVRVHDGPEAARLTGSISARAFTYRNHIWLGPRESAVPSFTMAHELAHVLQQTAPAALDAAVPGRPARVQRSYWSDPEDKRDAGQKHETYGALLQTALVGHRHNRLISEARVPQRNRRGEFGKMKCGFADIVRTDNDHLPGLENAAYAAGQGFREIREGGNCNGGTKFHMHHHAESVPAAPPTRANGLNPPRGGPGADAIYDSHGYPRIGPGGPFDLVDCQEAPNRIEVGEIKPGHNLTERDAEIQIESYKTGFIEFFARLNQKAATVTPGGTCKTPAVATLQTNVQVPAPWQPSRSGGWGEYPNLKLLGDGKTIPTPGGTPIRGRLSAAKDRTGNPGVWTYFLEARPEDVQAALGGVPDDADFTKTERKLRAVLDALRKRPSAAAKPQPRRRARAEGASSRRPSPRLRTRPVARPRIQRATARDASFDLKGWNALRLGDRKSLKTAVDKDFTVAEQAELKFASFAVEADDDYNRAFGTPEGRTLTAPLKKRGSKQARNLRAFGKAQFWLSTKAEAIGRLRETFGTAFVRLLEGFENMKRRLRQSFRQGEHSRRGGRIGRAAAAVGRLVLEGFGKAMLPKIMSKIGECLDTGLQRLIDRFERASGLVELSGHAAQARDTVRSLGDDVMADAEVFYERTIEPIEQKIVAIGKTLATIGDLVRLVKTLVDAARLGLCLSSTASGPGAIIGCAISAIDKGLSLFDMSPFDILAAKLMRSCGSQKRVAAVLVRIRSIRTLPQFIARKIVSVLKDELPPPLAGLFCKPHEIAMDDLTEADFTCETRIGGARRQRNADHVFGPGGPEVPRPGAPKEAGLAGGGTAGAGDGQGDGPGSGRGKEGTPDGALAEGDTGQAPRMVPGRAEGLTDVVDAITHLEAPGLTVDTRTAGKTFSDVTVTLYIDGEALPRVGGRVIHTKDWIVNGDGFRALEFALDPDFAFLWEIPMEDGRTYVVQLSTDLENPSIGNVILADPAEDDDAEGAR